MEITFVNDYKELYDEYEIIYQELAEKALEILNIESNYIIEVNLINDEQIQLINKQYRKLDRPTDVISFAFLDDIEGEVKILGDVPIMLGEIFISVDRAIAQSSQYGHNLIREMSFLFIHGILHLLGYNHETKDDEIKMFELQEKILKKEI